MSKWYIASKPHSESTLGKREFNVCTRPSNVSWIFESRGEAEAARANLLHGNVVRISSKDGEEIECTLRVEEDQGKFIMACVPVH